MSTNGPTTANDYAAWTWTPGASLDGLSLARLPVPAPGPDEVLVANTAIALNPVDWADIELTKDANGSYIWVNVQEGGVQRLWKLPVVDSNAVPEGEFLVGAMNIAAQVFDREEAAVEVSTEDGDNFRTNMVTIRAEERLALAVYRPESFVHGEFEATP